MPVQKYIVGLGLRHSIPKPNPVADMGKHPLSPQEGFLLSRVDGHTSYGEICSISGLGEEQAAAILVRLKDLKLILGEGEPVPKARPPAPAVDNRRDAHGHTPVMAIERVKKVEKPKDDPEKSILASLDDRSSVDPMLLTDAPDLDERFKLRVARVHKRLGQINPYQLLGLEPGAAKKDLRRGYFQASKEFHPDRYYGKNIGPFRQMLQDIFTQATRGFEALMAMDDAKRAAFDALLLKAAKETARHHR